MQPKRLTRPSYGDCAGIGEPFGERAGRARFTLTNRDGDWRDQGQKLPPFSINGRKIAYSAPWHFLYFLPLPQGQGSLRPTFSPVRRWAAWAASPAPANCAASSSRCFLRWNSFSSASMVVEGWRVGMEISRGAASSVAGLAALATGGAGGTGRRGSARR